MAEEEEDKEMAEATARFRSFCKRMEREGPEISMRGLDLQRRSLEATQRAMPHNEELQQMRAMDLCEAERGWFFKRKDDNGKMVIVTKQNRISYMWWFLFEKYGMRWVYEHNYNFIAEIAYYPFKIVHPKQTAAARALARIILSDVSIPIRINEDILIRLAKNLGLSVRFDNEQRRLLTDDPNELATQVMTIATGPAAFEDWSKLPRDVASKFEIVASFLTDIAFGKMFADGIFIQNKYEIDDNIASNFIFYDNRNRPTDNYDTIGVFGNIDAVIIGSLEAVPMVNSNNGANSAQASIPFPSDILSMALDRAEKEAEGDLYPFVIEITTFGHLEAILFLLDGKNKTLHFASFNGEYSYSESHETLTALASVFVKAGWGWKKLECLQKIQRFDTNSRSGAKRDGLATRGGSCALLTPWIVDMFFATFATLTDEEKKKKAKKKRQSDTDSSSESFVSRQRT